MGNVGSCVGKSSSSSPKKGGSPPKTPHGIPLPPGKPRLREGTETSLHVEWDKPESDGGAQILAYIIKMCRAEGSAWKKLDADCERLDFLAKDLEPGESYKFFIQCENDNGVSKPSEISDIFTTLAYDVTATHVTSSDVVKDNAVEATFGPSAEKYTVKDDAEEVDNKDTQSTDSVDSSKSGSSNEDSDKKSDKSDKSSNEFKKETFEETKSSEHTTTSSSAVSTTKSSERIMVTKTVQKSFTTTAGSLNEEGVLQLETSKSNDDIDEGTTLGARLGAYTYSNDSLLEESGSSSSQTREEIMTVHKSSNVTMTESQCSTHNRLPSDRDAIMDITVGNTLTENSDDIPSKFVQISSTDNSTSITDDVDADPNMELTETKVSETNTFSMTESKTSFETRIPAMKSAIGRRFNNSSPPVEATSQVTQEQTTTVKEMKIQSKLPTIRKTSLTGGRKDSIPEVVEEKSSSPKITSYVEVKKSERGIPVRRNSSGYTARTSGENSPKTSTSPRGENNNSPSLTYKASTETVPSGIAVRRGSSGSSGSPQTVQSRIPGRGTPSGIPAPRVIVENR